MKVIYINNNTVYGWLIKLFTFSKWSHTGIVLDEYNVIDAIPKKGVRRMSKELFLNMYPNHQEILIDIPDEYMAKEFAMNQIGKPYDWKAILGIFFRREWRNTDSWFCSELVEATLAAGGRQRFRDSADRITPHQSWSVI